MWTTAPFSGMFIWFRLCCALLMSESKLDLHVSCEQRHADLRVFQRLRVLVLVPVGRRLGTDSEEELIGSPPHRSLSPLADSPRPPCAGELPVFDWRFATHTHGEESRVRECFSVFSQNQYLKLPPHSRWTPTKIGLTKKSFSPKVRISNHIQTGRV